VAWEELQSWLEGRLLCPLRLASCRTRCQHDCVDRKGRHTLSTHLADALNSVCPAWTAASSATVCSSSGLGVRPLATRSSTCLPTAVSTSGNRATPLLDCLGTGFSSSPFRRFNSVFLQSVTIFETVLRSILTVRGCHKWGLTCT
jgi:hypothetical protein